MNKEKVLELAKQAGLEYNFDPMLWLKYEEFAEMIVRECIDIAHDWYITEGIHWTPYEHILYHFDLEKKPQEKTTSWACPKCGIDRTKEVCPQGLGAALLGKCPMIVEAQ